MLPLALICPPLAVLLAGRPSHALLNLGLTAFLYVPGVVHAWAVVNQHQTDRRNETIMRLAEMQYA